MKNKITCVIPTYNEEKRIALVLRAVYRHPFIKEIIVINDGSTDKTEEVIKSFKGIKLIIHKKNKGYTSSVLRGIKESKKDLIFLVDADLTGLNKKNISDIIEPVLNKKADLSMAIDYNSSLIMKIWIRISGLENMSGLRVFNKKFIKGFKGVSGYGFIAFMNKKIMDENLKLKRIYWRNVSNTVKSKKIGLINGTLKDIAMFINILKTVGIRNYIKQTFYLYSFEID